MKLLLLFALAAGALAASSPSGVYEGSTKVLGKRVSATVAVVDDPSWSHSKINLRFWGKDGTVECKNEEYTYDDQSTITIPGAGTKGNCIHDAMSSMKGKLTSVSYDRAADKVTLRFKAGFFKLSMELAHKEDAPQPDQLAPKTSLRPVISFAASAPAKVTDCTSAGAHAKLVGEVTITPNPPTRGTMVTIDGKGEVDEEVTGGTYEMTATYSGLKILDHTHSICGDDTVALPMGMGNIEMKGLTCPQAAGSIELAQKFPVPGLAPSGTIKSHFVAKDQNGDELICLDMEFSF